jgi:hypothetical protein
MLTIRRYDIGVHQVADDDRFLSLIAAELLERVIWLIGNPLLRGRSSHLIYC